MSFRDRSFATRFKQMGDLAEGVFEKVYEEGWVRYGICRPPINLSQVTAFVRFTPDYLTAKGLVEVQGFGNDRTVKFKLDKLDALCEWSEHQRVDLFLYDSTLDAYGWVRLGDLMDALATGSMKGAEIRSFREGNRYWAIPAAELPICAGWTDVIRSK